MATLRRLSHGTGRPMRWARWAVFLQRDERPPAPDLERLPGDEPFFAVGDVGKHG
jgi:hypothetical protein